MRDDVALVDTDVWSLVVLRRGDRKPDPRVAGWRRSLLGRQLVIAAQTEGELRFWSLSRGWGTERRAQLESHLARTPTAPVVAEVVRSYAQLRARCRQEGHPLAEKAHMGDAWIAATAVGHDLPLLSGDAIFHAVPTLRLLPTGDG